jgi:hypothetical protein
MTKCQVLNLEANIDLFFFNQKSQLKILKALKVKLTLTVLYSILKFGYIFHEFCFG